MNTNRAIKILNYRYIVLNYIILKAIYSYQLIYWRIWNLGKCQFYNFITLPTVHFTTIDDWLMLLFLGPLDFTQHKKCLTYQGTTFILGKLKRKNSLNQFQLKWSRSVVSNSLWPHGLYSLPGSSIDQIFQARILEWAAISFFSGSSRPRDLTQVSRIAGRLLTIWATREGPISVKIVHYCKFYKHMAVGTHYKDLS